jgi:hypothetical protein
MSQLHTWLGADATRGRGRLWLGAFAAWMMGFAALYPSYELIRMDIIDIPTLEDGDGDVAQVDGLLTGDGFRCALPILRALADYATLIRPTRAPRIPCFINILIIEEEEALARALRK